MRFSAHRGPDFQYRRVGKCFGAMAGRLVSASRVRIARVRRFAENKRTCVFLDSRAGVSSRSCQGGYTVYYYA
jgi:hypothetical protein